ncbi:unnamed protein product [Brachionus calyciflorus]|uniref:Mitochondrial import inner membrane translocase subunit n=1 Tax=Brachionus calyciflorus TaxID=104777 RepID=A0A814AUC7_9BILA|nr:unnamed protein product [Brachionus calyciflorus]
MNANAQLTQQQLQVASEIEIEMMQDLYTRMTNSCHKKCIPPKYHENDLTKGESVCIDRCVAKYFEIHDRVGKKLTALSTQQAQSQMAEAQAAATQS